MRALQRRIHLECADNGGALDFDTKLIQSGVALRLPPHSKNKSPNHILR
jgi:hypothetical protein